jgi:hypothetical protein
MVEGDPLEVSDVHDLFHGLESALFRIVGREILVVGWRDHDVLIIVIGLVLTVQVGAETADPGGSSSAGESRPIGGAAGTGRFVTAVTDLDRLETTRAKVGFISQFGDGIATVVADLPESGEFHLGEVSIVLVVQPVLGEIVVTVAILEPLDTSTVAGDRGHDLVDTVSRRRPTVGDVLVAIGTDVGADGVDGLLEF